MLPGTATIDEIDARIIRCLQLAPRVPFRLVADVLDVSEQTVARRYRRLVARGLLRVTTVLDPQALGQHTWIVRVQCRPGGASALADALARRDDVSWVTLFSGGSEVTCVLRARTEAARDDLLLQRLPRSTTVLGLTVAMTLRRFVGPGDREDDWSGLRDLLDDAASDRVRAHRVEPTGARTELEPGDLELLAALVEDGRAPVASLARRLGRDESAVARRLRTAFSSGLFITDLDVSVTALGYQASATLWLDVPPSRLEAVGTFLSGEPEVAFAAAVTGTHALTASVVCEDVPALYRFVTERVGTVEGVRGLEVVPILRHVKQAGVRTDGDRLADGTDTRPSRAATSGPAGR